jgi:hypothetical protein
MHCDANSYEHRTAIDSHVCSLQIDKYLISKEESKEESPYMSTINISISKYNYLMITKGFLLKILTLKESIR